MQPTSTRAPPVAQGGMLANIGARNTDMRKQTPVVNQRDAQRRDRSRLTRCHGGDPRSPAFLDPSSGLYKCSDWRRAEQRANANAYCISAVCKRRAWKIARIGVYHPTEPCHGIQCS